MKNTTHKGKNTYILGLSSDFHDSAAVLLKNGEMVAAAQEERFTRVKNDSSFPDNAISYCLAEENITGEDLDFVGYYESPYLKFERMMMNYSGNFPKSRKQFVMAIPQWLEKKLWIKSRIKNTLNYNKEIYFIPHHLSHAASAYYCSGYKDSAIITVDGVGEWDTTVLAHGKNNNIEMLQRICYPHSLGLLYSAFTYYLGFKVNNAEYKVMGLAPFGKVRFLDEFGKLIDIKDDGSFKLNMDYFSYEYDDVMITRKFVELFGKEPRVPESQLDQFHFDVARTLQYVLDDAMLKIALHVKDLTGSKNLCMAGGVALNCVANSKILESKAFENIFIQPASGDAGGALGVALYINNKILNNSNNALGHVFLGPKYKNDHIEKVLDNMGVNYKKMSDTDIIKQAAIDIRDGKVVGWFQDRMEFGPRALGNRSILANPTIKDMKSIVNMKIKFREGFRPFAPTVLEEDIKRYFDLDVTSPYMLLVAQTKGGQENFPAVTHVDNSARVQSVSKKQNSKYHALITEFKNITGFGMVLNTSFNVRGEPIVRSPEEALSCFFGTHMDKLVLQNYYVTKEDNEHISFDSTEWKSKFAAD